MPLSEEQVIVNLRAEIEDILSKGFCPNCLAHIKPEQVYCIDCGMELDEAALNELVSEINTANIRKLVQTLGDLNRDQVDCLYKGIMEDVFIVAKNCRVNTGSVIIYPHHVDCTEDGCHDKCPHAALQRLNAVAKAAE